MAEKVVDQRVPARLSVLLASESPVGVVLRRGPTKWVRVIMWDRTTDGFQPGPWFKGRILADRSDVSPDGRHLIYFAMGGMGWAIPATGGTWTAISVLPSLKAMSIWGQGDPRLPALLSISTCRLSAGPSPGAEEECSCRAVLSGWKRMPICSSFEMIQSYDEKRMPPHRRHKSRMERDGWVRKGDNAKGPVLEKVIPEGWILRKVGWYCGYEIERPNASKLTFLAWEWAEWDRRRLVWAEGGRLLTAKVGNHQLDFVRALYDFNPMTPPSRPGSLDAKSSQ